MNSGKRFFNKHVMITGSARGIGLEIAKQFSAEGAVLSLLDSNSEGLSIAAKQLAESNNSIFPYAVDITNRSEIEQIVGIAEKKQPIDILINNAGIARRPPFYIYKSRNGSA